VVEMVMEEVVMVMVWMCKCIVG